MATAHTWQEVHQSTMFMAAVVDAVRTVFCNESQFLARRVHCCFSVLITTGSTSDITL